SSLSRLVLLTAPVASYTLSLHDALPIFDAGELLEQDGLALHHRLAGEGADVAKPKHRGTIRDHRHEISAGRIACHRLRISGNLRSEEHTSELQSRENLVCRLLLEKKKQT